MSSQRDPIRIDITDPILIRIAALAEERHVDVYVVGGYVRDAVMGRQRTDIDITVVGDPIEFARAVAAMFHTKTVEYERFRTAMVPVGDHQLEFVGTRSERYEMESRDPIVSEGTLEDDLRRRDFTVNALAASLQTHDLGTVVDLFEGALDIERKVLRTPLDPIVTMNDDPLRMMRAARFASQLEFEIHPSVIEAITSMAERITIISQERITEEFLKILASPKPSVGLRVLFETGILKHIFVELHNLAGVDLVQAGAREFRHKDVFFHTLQVLDNVAVFSDDLWLRFATLMHDIAKPRTKRFIEGTGWTFHGHEEVGARWQDRIFRKLKLPLHHLSYVETLVRLHQRPMMLVDEGVSDSAIRRLAVQAGDAISDLFTLCRADITTRNEQRALKYLRNYAVVEAKVEDVLERDHLRAFQSPLRGEELMKITGLGPSRVVGYIKWMIEEAILDVIIPNEPEDAREYLMKNLHAWMEEGKTAQFGRRG
ncbi:MAG: CCA tRNA nucleotidyltransferase [Candidatus Kapabacteria bacterium]|nr:CCA tRNA nucleotidyltransferase [Candidatus Kapabacteria bacterium]